MEQLFGEILDAARKFSKGGNFLDDVCLVAVEICRVSGVMACAPGNSAVVTAASP